MSLPVVPSPRPVSPRLEELKTKYPPLKREQLVQHVPGDLTKVVTADGRVYKRGAPWVTLVDSNDGLRPSIDDAATIEHIVVEEGEHDGQPDMVVIRGLPNLKKPDRKYYKDTGPRAEVPINFCVELVSDPLESQQMAEINEDRNASLDDKNKPGAATPGADDGADDGDEA